MITSFNPPPFKHFILKSPQPAPLSLETHHRRLCLASLVHSQTLYFPSFSHPPKMSLPSPVLMLHKKPLAETDMLGACHQQQIPVRSCRQDINTDAEEDMYSFTVAVKPLGIYYSSACYCAKCMSFHSLDCH